MTVELRNPKRARSPHHRSDARNPAGQRRANGSRRRGNRELLAAAPIAAQATGSGYPPLLGPANDSAGATAESGGAAEDAAGAAGFAGLTAESGGGPEDTPGPDK